MMGNAPERATILIDAEWKDCAHGGGWWIAHDADGQKILLSGDLPRADLAPAPPAPKVKPLDISNVLRHAFLSGVVAAREIPGHEEIDGKKLWVDYEPYEPGSYERILAALVPPEA